MKELIYRKYRRSQVAELADWEPGVDMAGVSISVAYPNAKSYCSECNHARLIAHGRAMGRAHHRKAGGF